MNIGQLTAILSVNAAQLNLAAGALKKFETEANTSLNKVQVGLDRAGALMKTLGTAMSIGLTLPIAGLGVIATKTFREYELNLAHIIGLTGTSREQTLQWSAELMGLAKATAQGPNKLADALYFIASSGVDSSQAMNILTVSAEAAAAGLGDVNQVADTVTSALNAYAGTGVSATQITDQLVNAIKLGKAEAPGFAEAIGYAIPIAAELGVTFDQVAASMAAVSGVGVDVNTAALYLRQVLSDLLGPSHQQREAFKDMGTSAEILRKVLAEQGLLPLLMKLKELTAANGKTMQSVFPEVRSLTEALALTGKNAEHVAFIFDELKNNSEGMRKNALEPVIETLDFKFRQAVTNSQIALISLGEALKGPVSSALDWIAKAMENFANWFSNLNPKMQSLIITFAGIAAAAGPVLLIFSGLAKAVGALITPTGLVIAGITALAMGIAYVHTRTSESLKSMDSYNKSLQSLGGSFSEFLQKSNKETSTIISLFSALQRTNEQTIVRKNLIDTINKNYGQYIPHLITEKTTLSEINAIEKQLIETMKAKEAAKFREQKINAVLSQQVEREQAYLGKFAGQKAPLSSWIAAYEEYAKAVIDKKPLDNLKETAAIADITGFAYEGIQRRFAELLPYRDADNKAIQEAILLYGTYTKKLDEAEAAMKSIATSKTTTTKASVDVSGFSKAQEVIKDVEKEIENLNKIIASGDTIIDSAKEKVDIYTKGLKALSETSDVTNAQMVKMQDNLKQAFSDEVITNYIQTVEGLNAKMNAFGYTEELFEEALKAVNKALDELYSKGITSGTAIDYLKYAFENTKPPIEKVSGALDKMIAFQIKAGNYSKQLGDEVESTTNKMEGFSSALDAASGNNFASGITQLSNSFDTLKEKYGSIWDVGKSGQVDALKDVSQFATDFASVIQMMKDAVVEQFMEITNGVLDVINSLSGYVRQIKQNALDYAQKVADDEEERIRQIAESQNKSQKWLNQQLTANQKQLAANQDAINKEYGEKLKRYAILAAKINIAQGITKVLADKGLLGLPQAGLIYQAGQIQIKTIEAQQFAKGGIVPPGYSGDTYPALLSSGEMVTPPGKLPQMTSANIEVIVKGDWEISGEKLRYVLKETESRILNSY